MKAQRDTLAHIATLEAKEYTDGHERLKTEYADMEHQALLYTQQREAGFQTEIDNLRSE